MTHPDENQNAYAAPPQDASSRDEWAVQPAPEPDTAFADTDTADTAESATDGGDKVAMTLMLAFIGLAAVASVLMLFSSSTAWMKVGVLAALWAAVIGAVLVTRYRRQVEQQRAQMKDIEVRHQLELDRELATHREQELILEQNYLDSLESENDNTIAQLRAEIVALREQLSQMLGDGFDDEQVALRARAERLRELDGPQAGSPLKDPLAHDRPEPRALAHRTHMTASGGVGVHTNHGGPFGAPAQPEEEPVEVPVEEAVEPVVDADDATRVLQAVTEPASEAEPEPAPHHGRRRAEDHEGGLTVAELLAQMRKETEE